MLFWKCIGCGILNKQIRSIYCAKPRKSTHPKHEAKGKQVMLTKMLRTLSYVCIHVYANKTYVPTNTTLNMLV